MKKKYYCPHCKSEMKFKDMGTCLALYCPKCENATMLDYPDDWENVKEEYLIEN